MSVKNLKACFIFGENALIILSTVKFLEYTDFANL